MNIKKVIIPAAGYGTRFLPITKSIPKEMLPILNKPAIEYIVNEAMLSGINDFNIIISEDKQAICNYFSHSERFKNPALKNINYLNNLEQIIDFSKFTYIQQETQLGLGHAVLMAKKCINDDFFAVMLPDEIIFSSKPGIKQLIELAEAENACVVGIQEVPTELVSSYGIVAVKNKISENIFELSDLIEKPNMDQAPSNLAIIGRYILSRRIFDSLEKIIRNPKGEIQLTDAILHLLKTGQKLFAYKIEGARYDIGNPIGWLKANNEIAANLKQNVTT